MTTKFRTELVNTLGGVGVSSIFLGIILRQFKYGDFWYKIALLIVVVAGAIVLGGAFAAGINFLQGQGHQSGVSDEAEVKRSLKGSIWTTAVISLIGPILFLLGVKDFTFLWIIGIFILAASIFLWKVYWKLVPDTKPMLK